MPIRMRLLRLKLMWLSYSPALRMVGLLSLLLVSILAGILILGAPHSTAQNVYLHLDEGSSPEAIATTLAQEGEITHPKLFAFIIKVFSPIRAAQTGEYYFASPQHEFIVLLRVLTGRRQLDVISVTLPEGSTAQEMADILGKKIPDFDQLLFLTLALPKEGYLFPDTYFFFPGDKPQKVVDTLVANFDTKMASVATTSAASIDTISDIVIMASILEEEASRSADRRMIAGVLWNRINVGMALQVDAVFPYILGKNTYNLTRADLKTDSPYNTYVHKGLPAGPITNPGLDSLLAAMQPTPSKYMYYLSDRSGTLYFSKTYDEHLRLKRLHVP